MFATQAELESLALRIERAYALRRPQWHHGCSASRVWGTAAAILYQVHLDDAMVPLDPELFVASQPGHPSFADPWSELTQAASADRYRDSVRLIIRSLRHELRCEVRLAERRVRRGRPDRGGVALEGSVALAPGPLHRGATRRARRHRGATPPPRNRPAQVLPPLPAGEPRAAPPRSLSGPRYGGLPRPRRPVASRATLAPPQLKSARTAGLKRRVGPRDSRGEARGRGRPTGPPGPARPPCVRARIGSALPTVSHIN